MLKLKDFDYHLPLDLIAQKPVRPRNHSRLLLLDKKNKKIYHRHFFDLPQYLRPSDILVLNNSKVFPARLQARRVATGGQLEIFLHHADNKALSTKENIWECLIGGRAREGLEIFFDKNTVKPLSAVILKDNKNGTWQVKFNLTGRNFWRAVNELGEVPLPPYIKRSRQLFSDRNNYQTVFASNRQIGSAAAPTAGLHFTDKELRQIKMMGVKIVFVTLHVGLGTFAPVKTENIQEHKMHSEFASISSATLKTILKAKQAGGRIIAVGTTSCRTLESLDWVILNKQFDSQPKLIQGQSFWTDIFIYPGYKFKIVDALITNFHLPKSTLIMLISALAGRPLITTAYRLAISKKYRFFSYGDAMFIY